MKHYLYLISAAAVLLAASCQKESFESSDDSYADVSFVAELPGASTKAVADGTTVNTLYYEVYTVDAEGKSDKCVYDNTTAVSGKVAHVNVRLIKNKPYNVYFWAQYEAAGYTSPYTVENLQEIGVSYKDAIANDEGRDAFYKVLKSVSYAGEHAEPVYLRRAFAQVNVATADLDEVLRQGSRPVSSSLEISNLATSFNTFTGEGTEPVDATFSAFYLPGLHSGNVSDYTVANVQDLQNVGKEKKSYDYLATAYVLVPAAENFTSISSVKATVNYASDSSVEIIAPEATIQKNWRTNIYGNLLTASVDYNIEIDHETEGDHIAAVDVLAQVFANGGSLTLSEDVVIDEAMTVAEGVSVTLNLNGKTLNLAASEDGTVTEIINNGKLNLIGGKIAAGNDELSRRCIYNYGEMTIDGTEFVQTYNKKGAAINNEGKLTIEDATVESVFYSIWTSGANAETIVNGGTFTTTNDVDVRNTWAYAVNVINGAKLIINGGKFTGNHGVIAVTTGSAAVLNAGTFHCTAGYTGNSDWTLYANGEGASIAYDTENCVLSNDYGDERLICTENGAQIYTVVSSSDDINLLSGKNNRYMLQPGEYTLPNELVSTFMTRSTVSGLISFEGIGDGVIVSVDQDKDYSGMPISFKNITLKFADNVGFVNSSEESYDDCAIVGKPVVYGEKSSFTGCDLADAKSIVVKGETTISDCENLKVSVKTEGENASISVEKDGEVVFDEGVLVADADNLVEALEAGKDVLLVDNIKIDPAAMSNAYGKTGINVKNGQTIDGGGNTLDIKGAGGTWDSGINTTGGIIRNINVTGSFRGIFINHNSNYSEKVVLDNVTIDGTTYTISCDQGKNQGLEAVNSTFNGWTSYAATLGNAKFTGCSFGKGNGYAFCRPYAPTEFIDCDFEEGYEMDPQAAVTFENCRLNGVTITSENLATLVTSNIANATVK